MAPKKLKRRAGAGKKLVRRGPVAVRLELTLLALDKSAADIRREAGIAENAMSQYLSGERQITVIQALKLKAAYGVTLDWLYAGDRSQLPHSLAAAIAALPGAPTGSQGTSLSSKANG